MKFATHQSTIKFYINQNLKKEINIFVKDELLIMIAFQTAYMIKLINEYGNEQMWGRRGGRGMEKENKKIIPRSLNLKIL